MLDTYLTLQRAAQDGAVDLKLAKTALPGSLTASVENLNDKLVGCPTLDSAAALAASRDCPITQLLNPPDLPWSKQLNAILEPVEIAVQHQ